MVIARPIEGKYRRLKDRANLVLFALFLALPFIRIGGNPFVLLDIPARKFHVFGLTIWPQELYFLHLLLLSLGLMLFFFTALFGRLWCGYACPQTIFTEAYNWVGELVAGKSYGRPTMSRFDWAKVTLAWLALSFFFSFVFVAYFVPYETLFADVVRGNIFPHAGSFIPSFWAVGLAASTGVAFFNMLYFRENLCKYICPYGRFQAALIDRHSPIVMYDPGRGEPRRAKKQKLGEQAGDCIDCHMCVQVCPTGIDIRDGLQIGCLSCGLCVDACTQVLARHEKPTLIAYSTIQESEHRGEPQARPYIRLRTVIYGSLLSVIVVLFTTLLILRVPMYASAIRDKNLTNIYIPTIGYQNAYEVHVGNMSYEPLRVRVGLENASDFEVIAPQSEYAIAPGGFSRIRLILRYPATTDQTRMRNVPIVFLVEDLDHPNRFKRVKSLFSFPLPGQSVTLAP